jgi:hypothetical protein
VAQLPVGFFGSREAKEGGSPVMTKGARRHLPLIGK